MALIQYDLSFQEGQAKTETDIGVTHLQAEDSQRLLTNHQKLGSGKEGLTSRF